MLAKILAVSCLLGACLAAPEAQYLFYNNAVPAETLPVQVTAPNCKLVAEPIPTQTCVPRTENVCDVQQVVNEKIVIEKKCKEITSRHCTGPHGFLRKREASEEPREGKQLFYSGAALPATVVHAVPASLATVKSVPATAVSLKHHSCHDVTSESCIDHPTVVEEPIAVEKCHQVQKVDCIPAEKQVFKTVCEPVETDLRSAVGNAPFLHPFAYSLGF